MSLAEWAHSVGRQHTVFAMGTLTRLTGRNPHIVHSRRQLLIRIMVFPSPAEGLVVLEYFEIYRHVLEVSMSRFFSMALPIDFINFIRVVEEQLFDPILVNMVFAIPFETSVSFVHLVIEYLGIDVLDRKLDVFQLTTISNCTGHHIWILFGNKRLRIHSSRLHRRSNFLESFVIKFRVDETDIQVVYLGHTHGAAVH